MKEKLLKKFEEVYGSSEGARVYFAPGRVNLIGEHTDYNGGYVFPAAISFGTYALATKRDDRTIQFYSMNFENKGIITVDLDDLSYDQADNWANYPKGMVQFLIKHGAKIEHGFNVLYYGNIPNGAGLSSSASIELVTGVLLESLFEFQQVIFLKHPYLLQYFPQLQVQSLCPHSLNVHNQLLQELY